MLSQHAPLHPPSPVITLGTLDVNAPIKVRFFNLWLTGDYWESAHPTIRPWAIYWKKKSTWALICSKILASPAASDGQPGVKFWGLGCGEWSSHLLEVTQYWSEQGWCPARGYLVACVKTLDRVTSSYSIMAGSENTGILEFVQETGYVHANIDFFE